MFLDIIKSIGYSRFLFLLRLSFLQFSYKSLLINSCKLTKNE